MTDATTAPTPCDACAGKTPDDAAWFFCPHNRALAVATGLLNGNAEGYVSFGPMSWEQASAALADGAVDALDRLEKVTKH